MKLSQLAKAAAPYVTSLSEDCHIGALSADSRLKTDRGLFFCVKGARTDGHAHAAEAVKNGAIALMVTQPIKDIPVPQLLVSDDRAAMALLTRAYYGFADESLKLVGITGTKGKTTTSYLVKAVLERSGFKCGLIGTTGNMIGDSWTDSTLTTPDPIELHRTLRMMADAGCDYVVMEVSAHALSMHRLEGLVFEAGCFTNLSQDHLDFFSDMEAYYQAKKSFFTSGGVKNAAICIDDAHAQDLLSSILVPRISFGIALDADIFARDIDIHEDGVTFSLVLWNERQYPVRLRLMGMFNVYNALAAAAISLSLGAAPETICTALESVASVPGRAEVLDTHTAYKVILDYSHSPDAMENILTAVREFTRGRVIIVFGCGGDRDHAKRPIMGAVAGKLADISILTSDNPRNEDPMEILSAVEQGIKPTGGAYEVIENRREAIRHAMRIAEEGDVVLLAGKGHETYQEIHGIRRPFDEKQVVQELLQEMGLGGAEDA
ncbi:MAG: UDP-N-acetylmuramoyl-L-alanyl-D-glutamate--2,6-diaminopimelate ligase [Clostridiales bacterium]|nr:UDP-N-acetylmuramoyl-L-alanyl-D-glutamate--2,6-diaminopimelate ligase [Clostridiales bacterium]